jgi:hypothetical protein
MADENGPCCGHDHVGGDELWMTGDEIRDLVRGFVLDMVGDDGRLRDQAATDEAEQRRQLADVQRQADDIAASRQPAPKTWRERMWGV